MKCLMILTLLSLCLSMLACGNQDKSNLPKTTEAEVKISAEVKSSNNSKGLVDQVSLEKDAFLKQSQLEIKALNKEVGELELKVEKKDC